MSIRKFGADLNQFAIARERFSALALSGAEYSIVWETLKGIGLHGNAAHGFIRSMERMTKLQLSGERPAVANTLAVQRDQIHKEIKMRAEMRRAGIGRIEHATGDRVMNCPACGAPVVDSEKARAAHAARLNH